VVREDVGKSLNKISNFKEEIFIQNGKATKAGNELLKACYNIGILLLKRDLTVMLVFKIMRNAEIREQTYSYVLTEIKDEAMRILNEHRQALQEQALQDTPQEN
jgi:hypothetical protein